MRVDAETWGKEIWIWKLLLAEKVLRDDKIISLSDQKKEEKPKVISETTPTFIQDHKGTWIKNPEWFDN